MASPDSVSTRFEGNDSDWQYASQSTKRRKRASPADASRPSPREIGFMRESQNDGSATFLGSSSGIYFIRHVYRAFARRSADLQQHRVRNRTSVPGEDDRLQRVPGGPDDTNELWSKEEINSDPNASFTFEKLVHWTRRYFENWHPIFPCLHAPTILQAMEILGNRGTSAVTRLEMLSIRAIMSICLADSRQVPNQPAMGQVPATLVFSSTNDIMQDIQCLLTEPTTIPLLQAAFLAQLVLTSLLRLNAASRLGGVITRTAFHLGLHRCPSRFACFSGQDINIRRRLFWSIYSLERYLSQALGVPLAIRDDDIDVCYPGEEQHVNSTSQDPDAHRLRLLSHLAKFSRIRGLILELRNKSIVHSHAGAVETSHVNGELSQWWNEVYDDVNPVEDHTDAEAGDGPVLSPYHQLLLMVLRHEAIISMNRPLLAAENPTPDYKNALQTCIASSRSLLAAMRKYMSSNSDAPLTWPSFTWTAWMACLILMYASWEGELPVPTALKYARMGISVLQNLALRGSSWPETCIEAIGSMESALVPNQSTSQHEAPNLGFTSDRHPSQFNVASTESSAKGTRETRPPGRERKASGGNVTPTRCAPRDQINGYPDTSPTQIVEQPLHSTVRGVESAAPYDPVIFSPSNPANELEIPSDGFNPNGQTSADLIFGSMMGGNAPFNPSIMGRDSFPFADPSSFFAGDLWSVADGPWMIHENLS
ncbi:transcriptional regulator family: Fungal Specific TF [Penicillium capsulatum]|uniref:Transcriptional regulator family: Fungal Specific TF n=1 Tax=Penicillium capsulatum TaxID=69766 RepID=A0A9W9LZF2_9EURO|nr:transcriptional regulator family: Fungal Specific TF [Penicillium capsulatum]KAJ6130031.1 transcriptional regulator family: Fungal Specific TF [Penicillium capsulatum]